MVRPGRHGKFNKTQDLKNKGQNRALPNLTLQLTTIEQHNLLIQCFTVD